MKNLTLLIFLLLSYKSYSQINKQNNKWLWSSGQILDFNSNPVSQYAIGVFPNLGLDGISTICDSTGELLLISNGLVAFNKKKQIIANSNLLVHQAVIDSLGWNNGLDQAAVILPKKNNTYYIFTPTVSSTEIYRSWINPDPDSLSYRYDELLYCIVDMDANNGDGLVTKKKIPLLQNTRDISITGMTATKHANGKDWWLTLNSVGGNKIWVWQVCPDTILGPMIQSFEAPYFDTFSIYGQGAFSKDGSKYAFVNSLDQNILVADFNRCNGSFSNSKVFKIPIDTYWILNNTLMAVDSEGGYGCAFSSNNKFLYISTALAVKQLDLSDTNKQTQFDVIAKPKLINYGEYKLLYLGTDDKVYIGNFDGAPLDIGYINKPNYKGIACDLKSLQLNDYFYSPPNNPNYALGMDSSICWPLSNVEYTLSNNQISIYPNPTSGSLKIVYKLESNQIGQLEVMDLTGKIVKNITLTNNTFYSNINLESLQNGLYIYNYIVDGRLQESGKINIEK